MTPRRVRYSKTFRDQLSAFIEQGEQIYGVQLAEAKEQLVLDFIDKKIALTPAIKRRNAKLGLVVYPIAKSPFIVVYDYDDQEVRVYACLLRGAGVRLDAFDSEAIDW